MALIKDAQDILQAAIGIGEALSDGFQLGDVGALMDLPAAIDGWKEGVVNLKEVALSNPDEISDFVKENFDIPDDELEEKIEKSISWLSATYELYLTWK
jgi:hypothetical protein